MGHSVKEPYGHGSMLNISLYCCYAPAPPQTGLTCLDLAISHSAHIISMSGNIVLMVMQDQSLYLDYKPLSMGPILMLYAPTPIYSNSWEYSVVGDVGLITTSLGHKTLETRPTLMLQHVTITYPAAMHQYQYQHQHEHDQKMDTKIWCTVEGDVWPIIAVKKLWKTWYGTHIDSVICHDHLCTVAIHQHHHTHDSWGRCPGLTKSKHIAMTEIVVLMVMNDGGPIIVSQSYRALNMGPTLMLQHAVVILTLLQFTNPYITTRSWISHSTVENKLNIKRHYQIKSWVIQQEVTIQCIDDSGIIFFL